MLNCGVPSPRLDGETLDAEQKHFSMTGGVFRLPFVLLMFYDAFSLASL